MTSRVQNSPVSGGLNWCVWGAKSADCGAPDIFCSAQALRLSVPQPVPPLLTVPGRASHASRMAKPALTVVVEMQRQQDAEEERRLSQALALQAYRRVHSKRKVRVGVLFCLRMHHHQATIRGSASRQRPIASLAAAIPVPTSHKPSL